MRVEVPAAAEEESDVGKNWKSGRRRSAHLLAENVVKLEAPPAGAAEESVPTPALEARTDNFLRGRRGGLGRQRAKPGWEESTSITGVSEFWLLRFPL